MTSHDVQLYTFMKKKSEVFEKFKEFKASTSNQTACQIKTLRADSGGEYTFRGIREVPEKEENSP